MYMTVKEEKKTAKNPSTLTLIAFKPRQVILAEKNRTLSSSTNPTLMALVEKKQSKTLTAEDKTQLLHSILHYLQSNQFSKSLKYLLKDAQIQDDSWKASNLDLEDIYSKYLENSKPAEMKSDKLEQPEDVTPAQETVTKKNKKKTDEKVTEPLVCDSVVEKSTTKPKKNKKNKITSESLNVDAKQTEEKSKVDNGEIDTAKSKNKKKKNKSSAEPVVVEDEKLSNGDITVEESEVKPKEKKKKKEEKVKNDKNDSKKRKRLASSENENENENENQPIEEESVTGETKRRKIEESNGVEKSNKKKQQNGSVEPKTINPFQRVKVDEVEVDERLQDNSYWAKDGADIGYGAKAQEILGQVRGKDFRHEKTKKKRGSYRGGQIDLQSHSVKFNYSDEE